MITIRYAMHWDEVGLRVIDEQMTAFLRKFYRPTPEAIAGKAKLAKGLTRLVAVSEGEVQARWSTTQTAGS